jgi:hypothetical protein
MVCCLWLFYSFLFEVLVGSDQADLGANTGGYLICLLRLLEGLWIMKAELANGVAWVSFFMFDTSRCKPILGENALQCIWTPHVQAQAENILCSGSDVH